MTTDDLKPQAICCKACKKLTLMADAIEHSLLCKKCHYSPRKPTQMGPMELRQKIAAGKLSPGLAEQILETRKRNAKRKQTEVSRKRWAKVHGPLWKDLIALRNDERKRARAAYDYAADFKRGYRKYDATFYARYLEVLDRIGEELRRMQRNGGAPTVETWEELVTQEEQKELRGLWAEIPQDMTARGRKKRTPAILDTTTRIWGGHKDEDYGIPPDSTARTDPSTPPTEDIPKMQHEPGEWDIDITSPEN